MKPFRRLASVAARFICWPHPETYSQLILPLRPRSPGLVRAYSASVRLSLVEPLSPLDPKRLFFLHPRGHLLHQRQEMLAVLV